MLNVEINDIFINFYLFVIFDIYGILSLNQNVPFHKTAILHKK